MSNTLKSKKHVFEIISEDQEKKYYFATQSAKENKIWVELIQKNIDSNSKSQGKETIVAGKFNHFLN
jgi:hypothetical protein